MYDTGIQRFITLYPYYFIVCVMESRIKLNGAEQSFSSIDQIIAESDVYRYIRRPVIGISSNYNHVDENTLTHTYCDSVSKAGGIPFVIPISCDVDLLLATLRKCDALILTGGGDMDSKWWGEELNPNVKSIDEVKDYYDFALIKAALYLNLPLLAICRGFQALNVVLDGTLIQDLPSEVDGVQEHNQCTSRYEVSHSVQIVKGSRLATIIGEADLMVNSFHHQAVAKVAECGSIVATSEDAIIEAVDYYPEYNAIGVQWHPEALAYEGESRHFELFKYLIREAYLYRKARRIHNKITAIDSHVDTPSLLIGSPCADNRISKVNHSGMMASGMGAYFMAAYVPQGADQPMDIVRKQLDAIDELAQAESTKYELVKNVINIGRYHYYRKVLLKAVENGYCIGKDLSLLQELADRGVKYMTLCHNGDNQICDSAVRSVQTHNGLSPFGIEVIREMNRLHIAIDVSHASDKTIEDVLKYSKAPIILSHSSCRSLCPHPRNIPDELMQEIANQGGVIQMCMYRGFVKDDTATILDFIDHIEHAIEVVGFNHVGIGTDFDGGGEVIGCRTCADMMRITIELLRRGYKVSELEKIWGKNLIRVMSIVQNIKLEVVE